MRRVIGVVGAVVGWSLLPRVLRWAERKLRPRHYIHPGKSTIYFVDTVDAPGDRLLLQALEYQTTLNDLPEISRTPLGLDR